MTPTWESPCKTVRLWLADCKSIVPILEGVDAVVTDPPYGINATTMTLGTGRKQFHRGEWDNERPEISSLLSVGTHHCFWGGNYFTDELPPTNHWLIWHKNNDGLSFSECELAWTNYGKQTRHLTHHWGGEDKAHPTQKPLPVINWSVSFLPPTASVLDPFMGSGTTGVACVRTGRSFLGIEKEPKYFEIARRRISDELIKKTGNYKADPKKYPLLSMEGDQ